MHMDAYDAKNSERATAPRGPRGLREAPSWSQVADRIRGKLVSGQLPREEPRFCRSQPDGTSGVCHGCGQSIRPEDAAWAWTLHFHDGRSIALHLGCLAIWEGERAA
jgi:hypothetical protein